MQLDLFKDVELFTQEDKGLCNRCKKYKPRNKDNFAVKRVTLNARHEKTEWLSNTCKPCEKKGQSVAYYLRSSSLKYRTDTCDCCGLKTDKLRLDHDHTTEAFRGWLCDNCNTGIGRLGDDLKGVQMALDYLRKANER